MAIVPCGDETGEYYIIVSGLPWSATWQKLKDFVRYPKTGGCINVEHVYIYPSTTDGWVKVRGKEDFERAYEFEGKAIVADNRNGTGIVNLRDLAPIQTTSTRQDHNTNSPPESYYCPSSGYNSYPASTTEYHQRENPDSVVIYQPTDHSQDRAGQMNSQYSGYSPASTYSNDGGHSQHSPVYASSCGSFGPQSYNYATSTTPGIYLASPPPTPMYTQPMATVGYTLVPMMIHTAPPPPTMQPQYQYPAAEEPRRVVQTEARKIIITHLPHSITEKELQTLLEKAAQKSKSRSHTQSDEYPIESFEIPRHSDGKAKGHAFAVFSSSHIAKRVVEALHEKPFQRRELKVRLTKEGAESSSSSHHSSTQEQQRYPASHSQSQSSTASITKQMGQMSVSATADSGSSNDTEPKRERRSKGRSRTQDNVDSEREKSSRTTKSSGSTRSPVVIADGSGSRRK